MSVRILLVVGWVGLRGGGPSRKLDSFIFCMVHGMTIATKSVQILKQARIVAKGGHGVPPRPHFTSVPPYFACIGPIFLVDFLLRAPPLSGRPFFFSLTIFFPGPPPPVCLIRPYFYNAGYGAVLEVHCVAYES